MSTPLRDRTLATVLREKARSNGDRAFLLFEGRTYTYAEAYELSRRIAGGLSAAGILPKQHVAVMMENRPETVWLNFGLALLGAVAVPISNRLHAREAADIVDRGHARLCFASEDVAAGLIAEVEVPVPVFGSDEDGSLLGFEPVAARPRLPTDDAWIFFTSGTTGKPKGARLSHSNLWAMAAAYMADSATVASSLKHGTSTAIRSGAGSICGNSRCANSASASAMLARSPRRGRCGSGAALIGESLTGIRIFPHHKDRSLTISNAGPSNAGPSTPRWDNGLAFEHFGEPPPRALGGLARKRR